jgi:2-methylcitrate dehydratase PrpD
MSVAENIATNAIEATPTAGLSNWIANLETGETTPAARTWAKHAILDWFGVSIAGASEPLVDILVDEYAREGEAACTIVGRGAKATLSHAALINGAISHALDYDDVNRRLMGHATVTVAPVVLALGEQLKASGTDILTAFIAGTEAACLIGDMGGIGHYAAGYHNTATIGTLGAAMAAAKLMKLDETETRHALGIAASQAAGLKSNFGTMTKPLHAGKAAMNGLMAARLAARGFTANEHILETRQGVADVMMPGFVPGSGRPHPPGYFSVQQTLFKYHAACYLIHASIEAIASLRKTHGIGLDDLESMTLYCHPGHFGVCNIPDPTTGLEIKFSIRHCAAMALAGYDTSALETYSDTNAVDPALSAARRKITLEAREDMDSMTADVALNLADGRRLQAQHDAGQPASDLADQEQRLIAKFRALSKPCIGANRTEVIIEEIMKLDQRPDVAELMAAAN